MYSIVQDQCIEAMKIQLESEDKFESIETTSDIIKILKLDRYISYAYETKSYPFLAIHQALKHFYTT